MYSYFHLSEKINMKFYAIPKWVNDLFEYVDVPIKYIKISKIFYCVFKKRLVWFFLVSSVGSVEKWFEIVKLVWKYFTKLPVEILV